MTDVKWIKIVTDIFDDEKMLLIESLPSADSLIVIWFKLLCLAGKNNNNGVFLMNDRIAYTDEMLATIFRRDINTVRLALKTFEEYGMIEIVEGVITIPNWGKHQTLDKLEQKKEYMREYMRTYREKQKLQIESKDNCKTNSETNVNTLEEDIDKDKEKEKEKKKKHRKEIEDFFESVWKLYINKKGKDSVSVKTKEEIFKVGYERMKQSIEKYAKEVQGYEKRYILNGSTFFNGRYKDYLEEPKEEPQPEEVEEEPEMTDEEWAEKVRRDGVI